MITPLDNLLESTGQPGLVELRQLLQEILGDPAAQGRLFEQRRLPSGYSRVFRVCFARDGEVRSLVIKRLEPGIAQRNQLVINRWLPAIGLEGSGPVLLGIAAERSGRCVWHVYEDFGNWALVANEPEPERVKAAVALIAQLHTRFAEHALLPECRLYGADLGMSFFTASVRDAIRSLQALRPPRIELAPQQLALRDRLLARLHRVADEQRDRAQALAELGGPETLLHGDLWTTNTFVRPVAGEVHARLIDWDHAGVGPVSYDLSTFLSRFPVSHRGWILEFYCEAVGAAGWRLPPLRDLNLLFETAQYARFANRLIWPAIALVRDRTEWGFDALAEIEQGLDDLQPVLSEEAERSTAIAVSR